MNNSPVQNGAPNAEETLDVFVSYAHADDEVPAGADRGWVATLVGELQKVLRRKLGGAGARVWMDHQLAANQNVTEALLSGISRSRTLLLVLSPGYQKSDWCQRELASYVARASARGEAQSVFPIEIEPVDRDALQPALRSLTPIKFWNRRADGLAPTLAGFPSPKPDEDSLYWQNVNELAHLIAQRLQVEPAADSARRKASVVVAETTDDLDSARQDVVSALRQRDDVVVLPATDYPRGTEQDFIAGIRSDLRDAALFVQLLGPHTGKRAPGSERTFVAIQSREALRHSDLKQVMQWRPPELDTDSITDALYRELLTGQHVSRVGFEEFRRSVLQAVDRLATAAQHTQPSVIEHVAPPVPNVLLDAAAPTGGQSAAQGLSLYLQATAEDRDMADRVADHLASAGANVQLSPDPGPGQTFLESLMAQEEALRLCDGVLLVYGRSPVTAISVAFQYALRVFGVRRPGVWSAVLDLPPVDKQRVPIRSPNLMTIECRHGFEPRKLDVFFDQLRVGGTVQHA